MQFGVVRGEVHVEVRLAANQRGIAIRQLADVLAAQERELLLAEGDRLVDAGFTAVSCQLAGVVPGLLHLIDGMALVVDRGRWGCWRGIGTGCKRCWCEVDRNEGQ